MATEKDFEAAHKQVAKWEGGYSNHPKDSGGVTNYGISLKFLIEQGEDINKDGLINAKDVMAVDKEKAKELFRKYFWTATCAKNLPSRLAIAYYDLAVNAGPKRANMVLQEALNGEGFGLVVDGAVGKLTMAAVNKCNDLWTAARYCVARKDWYKRLCVSKPDYKVFLDGWINRTTDCLKLVVGY